MTDNVEIVGKMADWNFADVWETVAATIPDEIAQVHGERSYTWQETDRRATGIAALLQGRLQHQDKVAIYLYNVPEYMETAFACMKASLVPVNTNYRYGAEELAYLWDDADIRAVVFDRAFLPVVAAVRRRCPDIDLWIQVDDGMSLCPEWAVPYEEAAALPAPPVARSAPAGDGSARSGDGSARSGDGSARSGDDLILIYTGGTTGRPKGVMWRQHDLYRVSDTSHDPATRDLQAVRARVTGARRRPIGLSAAPLMHGTGFVFAGTIFSRGGTLVHAEGHRFDAAALLDIVSEKRVSALCIVGEAFARPIADALDAEPDRWDLSDLGAISSAGMVWRAETKQRILRHAPDAILVDLLNSSEASGIGRSITSSERNGRTGEFRLGANSVVVGPDGRLVGPGSGVEGRLAVRGHLPLGYYKDPEKTAQAFQEIDGVRYSFPGDMATVDADGSIRLLGRGSGVINTGGEKVFPEEVEEVLRCDDAVVDVIIVGIPDERMGEVVAGVVELSGAGGDDVAGVIERARERLAGYKLPKVLVAVDAVDRAPSGKADYVAVKRRIQHELEAS